MPVPLPPLGLNAGFLPFAVTALAMVGVTIFVLGKVLPADHRPPLVTSMLLALAVLGGGLLLLVTLVDVFFSSDGTTSWTWVLLAFNFMMMFPAGLWFVALILFRDRRIDPQGWLWPAAFGVVTTGSEALMGFLFAVGGPTTAPPALAAAASGLASVWFFWSMAAVMAALIAWAPLTPVEKWGLVALTLTAVLAPWVTTYPTVGGVGMALLMAVVFGVLLRYLLLHRLDRSELGLLFGLAGAFLAMAFAGLYLVTDAGGIPSTLAFGTVMAAVMVVEVSYLIRRFYRGLEGRAWLARPVEDGATTPGPVGRAAAADPRPAEAPAVPP